MRPTAGGLGAACAIVEPALPARSAIARPTLALAAGSALLALALGGGTALAGGFSLFGKKTEEPPPPPPPEAPPPPPAPVVPEAAPLFPDGVPVSLQATPPGLANLSAQTCNACHFQAHDDWSGTAHAAAWNDPLYQEAIERVGGSTACRSCHLPLTNQHPRLAAGYVGGDVARPDLQPNAQWDPTLMSEGVTCAACHVRDGKVLSTRPIEHAPHPMAVSAELAESATCATCHQLTWPEADQPFYDTYGEWERSAYAEVGVRCQDCHMPPKAGVAVASRYATQASHGFTTDTARAVSVLVDLEAPEIVRGEDTPVVIRVQNTGAGHAFPTGSPFKSYRVVARLVGTFDRDAGKDLVEPATLDLRREVEDAPPWRTVSDNRIPAGGEAVLEATFNVNQRKKAQRAVLRVEIRPVVEGQEGEALVVQDIPVPIL